MDKESIVRGYSIFQKFERRPPKEIETYLDKDVAAIRLKVLKQSLSSYIISPVRLIKLDGKFYRINVHPYNVKEAFDFVEIDSKETL